MTIIRALGAAVKNFRTRATDNVVRFIINVLTRPRRTGNKLIATFSQGKSSAFAIAHTPIMRLNRVMPNKWTCSFLALLGSIVSGWCQIFVSPSGSDANVGSSTKPVATLSKAIERSHALPTGSARQIVVQPGTYFDTMVALTSADSNLSITSPDGTPATLVGGIPLNGWREIDDRFWAATLPDGRDWDVRLLQVNGRFCPRARFPEHGVLKHLSVFDVPWMSTTGGGWKRPPTTNELTTLNYKAGDIPADLEITNAEITVFHMWDESVAGVSAQNVASNTLTLRPPLGHPAGAFGVKDYCIWNTKEGMTQPGLWYFDRSHGRIVYWPLPGEEMEKAVAIVPTQRSIIRIFGATNVTLRGLNLSVTTVPLVTGGFAAGNFDGAIQLEKVSGATLSRLQIRNVAGHAIKATWEDNSMRFEDCDFSNCGAGGLYLSGANNRASNNLIHDIGLMFPSAVGVNGGGSNSTLSHNEIYDTSYSAIDFGGENLVIENNLIYRCMKVMHDGGAIYSYGSKHTVIRGNVARDIIDTGGYGASSYYLDEQCRDCVVENNILLNVARPSHNHMATNNTVCNNVFITTGDMRLTFPRSTGYTLKGNVLYAGGSIVFEGLNNVGVWSKNVVYSGTGKIEGAILKNYSTTSTVSGVREDTRVADPLFVDLAKTNLHYKADSLALELGLKPLDLSQAGRVLKK